MWPTPTALARGYQAARESSLVTLRGFSEAITVLIRKDATLETEQRSKIWDLHLPIHSKHRTSRMSLNWGMALLCYAAFLWPTLYNVFSTTKSLYCTNPEGRIKLEFNKTLRTIAWEDIMIRYTLRVSLDGKRRGIGAVTVNLLVEGIGNLQYQIHDPCQSSPCQFDT